MNSSVSPYSKLPPCYIESDTDFPTAPSMPPNGLTPTTTQLGSPPAPMTVITVQQSPTRNLSRGACAACNTGILRTNYSLCAWCLCCCLFPCGILCCLCMKRKKCSHCGVVY